MADETLVAERPKEHRERRKQNRGRKVAPNQAMAVAKFIRVPPRKARLVVDEVRGKYAIDALNFLRFIPNRAAGYISKALASAVANAVNNHGLTPDNLKLVEARIDEGPRMKRMQPRAQGRAYRILKRMSHITVVVEDSGPRPTKPRKPVGSRAAAARAARVTSSQAAAAATPVAVSAVEETAEPLAAIETSLIEDAAAETPVTENTAAQTEDTTTSGNETPAAAEDTQAPESASDDATDEIGAPTDVTDAETKE